jgi:hypothetical protein
VEESPVKSKKIEERIAEGCGSWCKVDEEIVRLGMSTKLDESRRELDRCQRLCGDGGQKGLENNHLSPQLLIVAEKRKVKTKVKYIENEQARRAETSETNRTR